MPETSKPKSTDKQSVAVLKGSPEFHAWFSRFQRQLRLPAAILLDAAIAELARSKGFEDPPPR